MADKRDPVQILIDYQERFGLAGAFDRWIFPPAVNLDLMAQALQRNAPVTRRDVARMYERLYDSPLPEPPPKDAIL